jgi:SHS family lactate transporter-like MFS transporter
VTPALKPWWREPTRDNWTAFGAAWLGWVLDAFDFTIYLLVMPMIAREFGATTTQTAGVITLTLLIRLAGGTAAGWAADKWGRRGVLMASMLWLALFDAAIAFAPSFAWVVGLRILFGFGMGAEWTAGTTLAMESWPERSRGIASGVLQGSWAIGYLVAALAAAVVVPIWGWRALFLLAAAPALLVLPIRMMVKESPEWRARKAAGTASSAPASSWRDLLAPGIPRKIAWASLAMTLGFGVYYGLSGLYPTMLQAEHHLTMGDVAPLVIAFNIGMLIGAVACGAAASRYGVVAAIAIPAVIAVPILPLYVGLVPGALGIGAFAAGLVGVGWSGVTPLLLTKAFPAHLRARAAGVTYHLGALGAAFVTTGVAAFAEAAGITLGLSMALIASVLLLALVVVLLPARRTAELPATPAHG